MRSGPFEITDLDPAWGWSVTWPGFEMAVADSTRKVSTLLEILFDELKLDQAHLCVVSRNGEFDTFTIARAAYARAQGDGLGDYVAGHYRVGGVRFRQEDQARAFLEIMEQRLMWRRLGGQWTQPAQ
jgi:hypothetical protein